MRNKTLILCMIFCFSLLMGCASGVAGAPGTGAESRTLAASGAQIGQDVSDDKALEIIASNIAQSEEICTGLGKLIDWMEDDDEEATQKQMQEKLDDLKVLIANLTKLRNEIDALPAGTQSGTKLTINAAREYFRRLSAVAEDSREVLAYGVELWAALDPVTNFDPPESTTEYWDYSLFAGQLSMAVSQSQNMLKRASVPAYMADSHSDLVKRMDEYQSFCQDFSIAVQLDDPLRIYSCMYRMDRLEMMIGKCGDNLDEDLVLQFAQLRKRLNGSVAALRTELKSNIALLQR